MDSGQVVLRDLISLRKIRVEVVLAVELGERRDVAVQRERRADRELHRLLVHGRQDSRHAETHGAGVLVRRGIDVVRRATAEHLAAREQLRVDLEPDDHLVPAERYSRTRGCVGHAASFSYGDGKVWKLVACSYAWATRKTRAVPEPRGDHLQADGKSVNEPTGHRHARDARKVRRQRHHVAHVHGQRIVARSHRKRDARRGRAHDRVDVLEDGFELLAHERADFLRLAVVRVVVTARERVRAEHDPALDLVAESGIARLQVHVGERRPLDAFAEAHAVVAREVGRALRRSDDVVDAQRDIGARQRDLVQRCALASSTRNAASTAARTPGSVPSPRYSRGMPRRMPATPACSNSSGSSTARGSRRAVARVVSGDCRVHQRAVLDGSRERPDLVERGSERDEPIARDASVGRLESDHTGRAPRADGWSRRCRCRASTAPSPRQPSPRCHRCFRRERARCPRDCPPGRTRSSRSMTPSRTRRSWSCRRTPRRHRTDAARPFLCTAA